MALLFLNCSMSTSKVFCFCAVLLKGTLPPSTFMPFHKNENGDETVLIGLKCPVALQIGPRKSHTCYYLFGHTVHALCTVSSLLYNRFLRTIEHLRSHSLKSEQHLLQYCVRHPSCMVNFREHCVSLGLQAHFYIPKLCWEGAKGYMIWECSDSWHDQGYWAFYCIHSYSGKLFYWLWPEFLITDCYSRFALPCHHCQSFPEQNWSPTPKVL